MEMKAFIRIAFVTGFILLIPLVAMQFTDEVVWDRPDFVIAGVLLFGAGLTHEWIAGKSGKITYRAPVGLAVVAGLLLVWVNLAVGIIGNEENPANLMYVGVLAVAVIGALIARFQAQGMALAMLATAVAQVLVAIIAVIGDLGASTPNWPRDVLGATGFFVALWLGSAWLFRNAARKQLRAEADPGS